MEANFDLIVQPTGAGIPYSGIVANDVDNPEFKIPNDKGQLIVGLKPEGKGRRNRKRCLDLEAQLAKELERDKWAISVKLKVNTEELLMDTTDNTNLELKLVSFDVSVEGEVLAKLHSMMLYGLESSGRLDLSLEGTLQNLRLGQEGDQDDSHVVTWDGNLYAELFPQGMEDGDRNSPPCSRYTATNVKLTNDNDDGSQTMLIDHAKITKWRLYDPHLMVGSTWSDFNSSQMISDDLSLNIVGHYKRMLKDGTRADLEIIGENGATIPCHSCVLAVRSPVVAAKFSGRFENDASRPTIDLRESSKEEITAFLEFLYYGGTGKTLRSPSMAMAVFQIGQFLLVEEVHQTVERILLTRPAKRFSVEDGLQLYHLGMKYDKHEFQRKAVDVLGIRSMKDIKASELFLEVLPSPRLRKEFRKSRKQF